MKCKSPRVVPNVRAPGFLDLAGLRTEAQANPDRFAKTLEKAVESEGLRLASVTSLRSLYKAFGDVQVKVERVEADGFTRAIMASAFPVLVGNLMLAEINEALDAIPDVTAELVRDIPTGKKINVFAGVLTDSPKIDRVDEADAFPELGAGQETFTILTKRDGRKVSITKDLIEESNVADLVMRINALAEYMRYSVMRQTLRAVCDVFGSATSPAAPYALTLNNSAASLYSTTANTPGTRAPSGTRVTNNPLSTTASLEAVRTRLNTFLNQHGHKAAIPLSACKLLVPDALLPTALKLMGSLMEPGVENERNNWGPQGEFRPRPVSTPLLDEISTTAYYLGDFQRQFVRAWKLQMEYVELGENTQAFLDRRVAFQARIGWDVGIGAVDYARVVQSLSGTTAPTAPSVGA
jgi:hypothetical protein